jgi:hypothetical protein
MSWPILANATTPNSHNVKKLLVDYLCDSVGEAVGNTGTMGKLPSEDWFSKASFRVHTSSTLHVHARCYRDRPSIHIEHRVKG